MALICERDDAANTSLVVLRRLRLGLHTCWAPAAPGAVAAVMPRPQPAAILV